MGLDSGLAPTRQQAIIWANNGCFTAACMRNTGLEYLLYSYNVWSLLTLTLHISSLTLMLPFYEDL